MRHWTMPVTAAIRDQPLSYVARLERRDAAAIDLVVIHCTELPDLAMAREFGERIRHAQSRTGNSGHYYIDRDGGIVRFVGDERVAHHAFGYNARSIGIELVNRGRYPHWNDSRHQDFSEAYADAQIEALLGLLAQLRTTLPDLRLIAGHEDLDRRREPASDDERILLPRRRDPGPLFPWPRIVPACGLQRLFGDAAG
jgi:N-acetylmuramoyl-L-alanine amidase